MTCVYKWHMTVGIVYMNEGMHVCMYMYLDASVFVHVICIHLCIFRMIK